MTDIQFTTDFIRKSEIIKDGKIHIADNIIPRIKHSGMMKVAKALKKYKILSFFNKESNNVVFVKENNPNISVVKEKGHIFGYYKKGDNIVILTPTQLY